MKFYLIVAKGPKQGMPIPINVDLFLLGSDPVCQLRSAHLAPKHCAFVTREHKVFFHDFACGQATLINSDLVPPGEELPLHAGDLIDVGNLQFMIQWREPPLSRRDLEEWAAKCLDEINALELFDEDADEFRQPTNASEVAHDIIEKLTAQKGMVMGRLRIGKESGVTTVRFNDTMLVEESEIALIHKELSHHLGRPNLRVLLDCKNIRRMSTSAVTMLRDFHKWLKNFGSRMALCRMRSDVQSILPVFHADNIPYFPDKRTAFLEQW